MKYQRCIGCMRRIQPGETACPVCGNVHGRQNTPPHVLQPGTILQGRFLVGRVLGQGGFGITYIGFDLVLEKTVAIKEYYPASSGIVSRNNRMGPRVYWSSTVDEGRRQKGYDTFLKEARKMAKLDGLPGVVSVLAVLQENDTAYIVMDYISGVNLREHLIRVGVLPFPKAAALLTPVIRSLDLAHKHGIIHRDISPDNIMVCPDGTVCLLDLGAAKEVTLDSGGLQSSQLVVKPGFSPAEQYMPSAQIGAFTDVYAMTATLYFCITGKVPPVATDRLFTDNFHPSPALTADQRKLIERGMAVRPENRLQTMAELLHCLQSIPEPSRPVRKKAPTAYDSTQPAPKAVPFEPTQPATQPVRVHTMAKMESADFFNALSKEEKQENQYFWGQKRYRRNQVQTIAFRSSLTGVPKNAWDVSAAHDNSIRAWMEGSHLFVAANGSIAPDPEASFLFAYFTGLSAIDFGGCFDTSAVTEMSSLFVDCCSLTTLDLSGFRTENVTSMNGMFLGCKALARIRLDGLNTSRVTSLVSMFHNCESLIELDLSGFDTRSVTDMQGMFQHCVSLTSLDLRSFDTSRVTDFSFMFYECQNLIRLDVSGFNTRSAEGMFGMFYDCRNLTELDITGFRTEKVTDMLMMFWNCCRLKYLDVSRFDTSQVQGMSLMFARCSALHQLDTSRFSAASATDVSLMFYKCENLTSLDLSDFRVSSTAKVDGIFDDCRNLRTLRCVGDRIQKEYDSRRIK